HPHPSPATCKIHFLKRTLLDSRQPSTSRGSPRSFLRDTSGPLRHLPKAGPCSAKNADALLSAMPSFQANRDHPRSRFVAANLPENQTPPAFAATHTESAPPAAPTR